MTGKRKILVVDDDSVYRKLLTFHLTKQGYEVQTAADGLQAFSWLGDAQNRPDLILLDLLMPRLSGLELLEKIRAMSYRLPVILISGVDETLARQTIGKCTPDAFVSKPFSMPDLLHKIESLL